MKLILSFILLILLNVGCSKWCANHAILSDTTTYSDIIVYRDTVIKLPGDTMILFIEGMVDTVYIKETIKQKTTATVKGRNLNIQTICKDDSLKAKIASLEKTIKTVKSTVIKVTERVTPFWNWVLYGALAVVILFLLIKSLFR